MYWRVSLRLMIAKDFLTVTHKSIILINKASLQFEHYVQLKMGYTKLKGHRQPLSNTVITTKELIPRISYNQ